jgi:RND family efflux transporter MFP subunit
MLWPAFGFCAETQPQETGEGTFERDWPAVSMAYKRATLSSKLDERIASIVVKEGQAVKKGDVLLRFSYEQIEAKIAMAEVDAEFKDRIESSRTRYEFLSRESERSKKLSEGAMIPEAEFDKDRTEKELARLEVEELKRNSRLADTRLRVYKAEAEDYVVRSPIDGVVADLWVKEGEMARVGQALLEVLDPKVIEVRVHLREEHSMNVSANQEVAVKFPAASERPVPGAVYFVAPNVDSSSGTFTVKILTEPGVEHIKPGMSCQVRFLPPKNPEGRPEGPSH